MEMVSSWKCIRSSSDEDTWKCISSSSDEDILVSSGRLMMKRLGNRARMKVRLMCTCIELRTCMSSYRCHRPGNASDRARMKTFSFRLGDLDGNAYDIHRTCVIGVIGLYRCHRPETWMEMVSSDVYMSVIRKCIRSSSEMHQIELG